MTKKTINRLRAVSAVLSLVGLLTGILAAAKQLPIVTREWAALAVALIMGAHGWLERRLPPRDNPVVDAGKVAGAGAVLLGILLIGVSVGGCKSPYHAAWGTMSGIIKGRDLTASSLAQVASAKHQDCIKQHGSKTEGYATCIKPYRAALVQWRKHVRPSVNSALQVAAASVQIAERAKDKTLDWMQLVKPAACALLRVAKQWGHMYPDQGKSILGYLVAFEGVACN